MLKVTIKEAQVAFQIRESFGFGLLARDENDNLILRKKHDGVPYFMEVNVRKKTAGIFLISENVGITYKNLVLDTHEVRNYLEIPSFQRLVMEDILPEVTWLDMNTN